MHGLDRHGCSGVSQFVPVCEGKHEHVKPAISSLQVPPFSHGSVRHSLISSRQVFPVKPAGQAHEKLSKDSSMHVALGEQGFVEHRFVRPHPLDTLTRLTVKAMVLL